MRPWSRESAFVKYLGSSDDACNDGQDPTREIPDPLGEIIRTASFELLLSDGISSLEQLSHLLKKRPELSAMTRDLGDILGWVRDTRGNLSEDEVFRRLHPYRSLISSFSSSLLNATNGDEILLIVIAYFFATFVAVTLRAPLLNLDFLISVRLQSIISISKAVRRQYLLKCECCNVLWSTEVLMLFPHKVTEEYQATYCI
jgi:hypothetical protein